MSHTHTQCDVVQYKGNFWIVLQVKASGYLRIIAPHMGNGKREIRPQLATPTGHSVTKINYRGKDVLVTRRGMLVSMVSERLLKNTTQDGKAMVRNARNGVIDFNPTSRSGSVPYEDFDEAEACEAGINEAKDFSPGPAQYNANGVRIGRLINM